MKIALAVDNHYVIPCLVSLWQISRQERDDETTVNVGFFEADLSEKNRQRILSVAEEVGLSVTLQEFEQEGFGGARHVTRTSKIKLLMLENLGVPFLWLDVDTLLRPGALLSLETECGGQSDFGAVPRGQGLQNFNSGVFFSGIKSIRRSDWLSLVIETDFYSDQGILQRLFSDRAWALPKSSNVLHRLGDPKNVSTEEARILHFTGIVKPWSIGGGMHTRCSLAGCAYGEWLREFETLASADVGVRKSEIYGLQREFQSSSANVLLRRIARGGLIFKMLLAIVLLPAIIFPLIRTFANRWHLHPRLSTSYESVS